MARRDKRKRKGGRYTPPSPVPSTFFRSDNALVSSPLWMTNDAEESAAKEEAFFGDGVTPEKVFVLFPTGEEGVDSSIPATLVAIVDPAHWPTDSQKAVGDLMAARSAHPDEEWPDLAEYRIGWSSIMRTGEPGEVVTAATKLNLEIHSPLRFKMSFIFDLTQVLPTIKPVVNGGIFAVGTMAQMEYLTSPDRTYADAIEMLPVFEIPASTALAGMVEKLEEVGF